MALSRFTSPWKLSVVTNALGEFAYLANDAGRSLGIKRPDTTVGDRIRDCHKCTLGEFLRSPVEPGSSLAALEAISRQLGLSVYNASRLMVLREPGFYALVFKSRQPDAEAFQDWVFEEVLPSIRKTGAYSCRTPEQQAATILETIRAYVNPAAQIEVLTKWDRPWFSQDDLGGVIGYAWPRQSVQYHAKQSGDDAWFHRCQLEPNCPRFLRYRRFCGAHVVLRTLLRSNMASTRAYRTHALNDALPAVFAGRQALPP
jgi:prophage antirepressor-like protein